MKTVQRNPLPFSRFLLRRYPLKDLKKDKNHSINGLDTETLNGYAKLICDGNKDYVIIKKVTDALDFLTHSRYRNAHNFFYNLRYDAQAVLKYLPRKNLLELAEKSRTRYRNYKIKYINKKLLRITKNNHTHQFFDLAQFYNMSLDHASKIYLSMKKKKENLDIEKIAADSDYWIQHEAEIVKYCVQDAKLCELLAKYLQAGLKRSMKSLPQKYISKAGLAKEYLRKYCNIPDVTKIDRKVLQTAFQAYRGGRFEILKRGNVGECILYDINSAYPYHISELIDITKGQWKKVTRLHNNAFYGFYLAQVTIRPDVICPLPFYIGNATLCYPAGQFYTYVTRQEIEAYASHVNFEIVSGYEFFPSEIRYPFRDYIHTLYTKKSSVDKMNYEYQIFKILMNAIYGSFYEKVKHGNCWMTGKLFNPIYATITTANGKIQLWQTALAHKNKVVGFATDSILFQKGVNIRTRNELGEWKKETEGKTVVLKSGVYQVKEKFKTRGVKTTTEITTPHGKYANIFEYIKQHPELTKYKIIISRPLQLFEALAHSKMYDKKDINVWQNFDYEIDINYEVKRIWDKRFECGGEIFERLISSKPLLITS